MQTYFWLLSLLESWDFYRCSCYHTFEVISPRISKKNPFFLPPQNASKASTILFAEILQERLISADGNPAFQRMDYSLCAVIKMHTNIILHTYLHTLPYVQEKQWNCKKKVLTKNLVSQKLSNPSLNELKFKKTMPFRMA